MPPKAQKGVPGGVHESSLTVENFEKELQALASKAREQTTFRLIMRTVALIMQAAQIVACAGVYSIISQLTLSPVYGSIPSSIWHARVVVTSACVGWAGTSWVRRKLPRKPVLFLAPMALSIPMMQSFLFLLSSYLGPMYGPPLTELLTLVPLIVISAAAVDQVLQDMDLSTLPNFIAEALPGMGSFFFFQSVERFAKPLILNNIGANFLQSRVGFQLILGGIYTSIGPSALLLGAIPGLFHTAFLNPHIQAPWSTFDLNLKMERSAGFKLLARQDSITGYLSVLENTRDKYRVLRCDHSLLGGVWLPRDGLMVNEPIYGVFAMLEAVRLIQVDHSMDAGAENALVIGLGIGTTPTALISHGIDTTIVEIDPVVRKYALEYFALPDNHTPVIADAVKYSAETVKYTNKKFDYIVHDVFTGGAEPLDLFTAEFLGDLVSLLKPNGAIAINYAGDLLLPSARLVVRTIKATFPTCRIFRENPRPDAPTLATEGIDFTNMVIFCTKQGSKPVTFRKPVEADYLGSEARKMFLVPQHEIEAAVFAEQEGDESVLSKNNTEKLSRWQRESAVGHWRLMRTVLPSEVWENW